uniref:Uncharacterized protein n=1 Tax=Phytophthora ramorum TaxID=164328 RepID=H3GVZ8_PHYRM
MHSSYLQPPNVHMLSDGVIGKTAPQTQSTRAAAPSKHKAHGRQGSAVGATVSTNSYGRHSSDSYRDLNPAYFHIAAVNLLGSLNSIVIVDVTAGSEVLKCAMFLEEDAQTAWRSNRGARLLRAPYDGPLMSSGSYTAGAYYYYLLEMDDAGAIVDDEWVYDSDDDHLDFRCFPKSKLAADTATNIGRATLTRPCWPARVRRRARRLSARPLLQIVVLVNHSISS